MTYLLIRKIFRVKLILILSFISLSVAGQRFVVGKVVDELDQPLFGSNIYIPELETGTSTREAGTFKLSNLPAVRITLRVSYLGYETQIKTFNLKDTSVNITIKLEPSTFQSEEVVISGGRPSSQHENAIKIETITVSQLANQGTPSLMRSLASVPGVSLISKGEGVTTPVIRGLSTSNILVLNNGVRMENYQFSENHPYLIDESGMEQVEIIKGPASLLYGSDAIGGVLNFIHERNAGEGTIVGSAGLQYHSNTNGIGGNLGIKGAKNQWTWGFRGAVKSHVDYLQGNGDYVPNSRFNQAYVKAGSGYSTANGIFRLSYEYFKMKPGMTVDAAIPEINQRGRWNDLWYQDLDHHLISSRNTLFLNKMKLGVNLAYQHNHRRLKALPDDEDFIRVDAQLGTFNYEFKSEITPSDVSNFIIAIQGMSQVNKNGEAPDHVLPDYNLNDISLSGLVQHDFRSRIHLQAGLRLDNRIIDIPEQIRHGHDHEEEEHGLEEEEEMMEELKRYYGNLSGSLGITIDLTEKLLLRGNFSSAYRTPNVAELTQDGAHGVRYEQGDRDLESQRNFEPDISLHYHSGILFLDLAAYYNLINNYIFLAPTVDTTDHGEFIYQYTQGNASIYGFEGTLEVLATRWLSFKGNYGYARGKQENGSNLPFIPQNKMNIGLKLFGSKIGRLLNPNFTLDYTFAFSQDNPADFEQNSPGYSLVNLGGGIEIPAGKQRILLSIVVSNLLDEEYIDHLSTLRDLGFSNAGRNIMVNLVVPFGLRNPKD